MSRTCRPELHISGGFWLLIAWFALANGWNLLGILFSAATLHELGHCAVLYYLEVPIRRFDLGACGAVLEPEQTVSLSYGEELAVILAGPAVNFLCSLLSALLHLPVFSGANLLLCLFNLLPLRPLDGGRALELLVSWLFGPAAGEQIACLSGIAVGTLFALFLSYIVVQSHGSLWLLPSVCGILAAVWRECAKKRRFL